MVRVDPAVATAAAGTDPKSDVPGAQYPAVGAGTPRSAAAGSAHRVLQLASQHNFYIAEDDTYSHLAPDHATRLCVLDGLQRTIYVSGFSKILAPGWRVGFMAAPPDLVERLLNTKLLGTLTTPALLERALAWCIDQGQLRRHAERIRTRLDQARARSVKLALAHGGQCDGPPGLRARQLDACVLRITLLPGQVTRAHPGPGRLHGR